MINKRKENIINLLKEDPEDDFLNYALAIEERAEGKEQEAISILTELLDKSPNFIATYYTLAELLLETESLEEALKVCEKGIRSAPDTKTTEELKRLKRRIQDELEEY